MTSFFLISKMSFFALVLAACLSALVYLPLGPVRYLALVVAVLLRPMMLLCFVLLVIKVSAILLCDMLYRDYGLTVSFALPNRRAVLGDMLLMTGILAVMWFWYQHGGFSLGTSR